MNIAIYGSISPFLLAEGVLETTSLSHKCRGKAFVHPTLPRPHLWDCVGYVVVLVGLSGTASLPHKVRSQTSHAHGITPGMLLLLLLLFRYPLKSFSDQAGC